VNKNLYPNERFRYCAWMADSSTSTEKVNKIKAVITWADSVWSEYFIRKQQIEDETKNIDDIKSQYMYVYDSNGNKNICSYTVDADGNVTVGDVADGVEILEDNSVSVNMDFSSLGKPPYSFLEILNTP
jgi:hypothetical protein